MIMIDPDTELPLATGADDEISFDIDPPGDDPPAPQPASAKPLAPVAHISAPALKGPPAPPGDPLTDLAADTSTDLSNAVTVIAPAPISPEESTYPHHGSAERTGRTGIFFTPQHLTGDLDDLPHFEAPAAQESGWQYVTGRAVNPARRFMLTRLAPVLALSGVILWSYLQLTATSLPRSKDTTLVETGEDPVDPTNSGTPTHIDPPLPPPPEPEPLLPGLKLRGADVTEILADGTSVPVSMGKLLARDRVTVLNLWATFCEPCKAELPAFRELFEQQKIAWRGEVEFMPVQISDPVDGASARREYAALMPAFRHFVSDRGLPSGLGPALAADGHSLPVTLPVTIVVHCSGKVEQLFSESFDTVDKMRPVFDAIGRARSKLSDCRNRSSPAPESDLPRAPPIAFLPAQQCGDAVCLRGESCRERHGPGRKPACVAAAHSEDWGGK